MDEITKINFDQVDFEIVPDEFRLKIADYSGLPAVKALIEGKTIKVPENTATSKLYRYSKAINRTLRKRKLGNSLILWFEIENQHDGITD